MKYVYLSKRMHDYTLYRYENSHTPGLIPSSLPPMLREAGGCTLVFPILLLLLYTIVCLLHTCLILVIQSEFVNVFTQIGQFRHERKVGADGTPTTSCVHFLFPRPRTEIGRKHTGTNP
jgi:hypothetical protein